MQHQRCSGSNSRCSIRGAVGATAGAASEVQWEQQQVQHQRCSGSNSRCSIRGAVGATAGAASEVQWEQQQVQHQSCSGSNSRYSIRGAVGATAGAASEAAELRKHTASDAQCTELGWVSIPPVVEYYEAWGKEAQQSTCNL